MPTAAVPEISVASITDAELTYAVVGNPNSGKTTLFNALTGLRQKVANYPGVTVEKKVGWCYSQHGKKLEFIDLPGAYSLSPRSRDESIARDVLFGLRPDTPTPDRVLCVVDACNLDRNLYIALQVIELGLPVVIALTMIDLARDQGLTVDAKRIAERLGVPVVACEARNGIGLVELKLELSRAELPAPKRKWSFPALIEAAVDELSNKLQADFGRSRSWAEAESLLQLSDFGKPEIAHLEAELPVCPQTLAKWHKQFKAENFDWRREIVESRYAFINEAIKGALTERNERMEMISDRIDAFLTQPFWGLLMLAVTVLLIFFTVFSVAEYPMNWIDAGFAALSGWVASVMPEGDLRNLITDGVIAGVGGVVIFLPQILMLFFFITISEESGYLARTALLLDRAMSAVGLHGKSFLPLISSYACAIPGIMATRTIENERSRLATILVLPWMSCSARLPVYTLLIAAFLPSGGHSAWIKAGLMMSMYVLGTAFALLFAWIFQKFLMKGEKPVLVMELPSYRMPMLSTVLSVMWERSVIFLKQAGTVILAISIVLWFLTNYPKVASEDHGAQLQQSYAGQAGKLMEPLIKPLGFDWKIGIGLVTSFAAREVFVGTMSIIHNVGESDDNTIPLRDALVNDKWPDGRPVFTPLTCLSLMVFYVFAMQCLSTLAVVRRETNSWRWPAFQFFYMLAVAYTMSLLVYQVGRWWGFA